MDRVGLVGLPNSGKSALFNALTGGDAVVAPHPFSTTETEIGVAHVPDPRVDALAKMSESRKVVYAGFEVVDIAAVGKGVEKGDGSRGSLPRWSSRGGRHLSVAAEFRGRERAGRHRSHGRCSVLELELALSDAGNARDSSSTKKRSRVAPLDPAIAAGLEGGAGGS